MRIIPAIDIIDGKCVRLTKGNYNTKKIYCENPLYIAKKFEDNGIEYLHLIDLDGAKSKHIVNHKVLETICSNTKLQVDFGGGIKTDKDLKIAFHCGASQVTSGSIAVKESETYFNWLHTYGPEKIILGADCMARKIAYNGWQQSSELDVIDFIKDNETKGIKYVLCTDIAKDGMLLGPSIQLYQEIIASSHVKLIASGGITAINDLYQLKEIGCEGAVIGKALYEGKINLKELQTLC